MKIYLDTCCLNRPFDDQSQKRIHIESEAIILILIEVYKRKWEWIGSEILEIEIEQIANIERKNYLKNILRYAQKSVIVRDIDIERGKQLEQFGFKSFDAMHIACAERGKTDIFLTTDDKLLKLYEKTKDQLRIVVKNPLAWLIEVL
jgi:predicted nucleic acid-binding protein